MEVFLKTAAPIFVFAMIFMLLGQSCDTDNRPGSKSSNLQPTKFTWKKVIAGTNFSPTDNNIRTMTVSDDKWLYAAGNHGKQLFVVNATKIQDLFTDTNWRSLSLSNTGLTPAAPGKIPDLTQHADMIFMMSPTRTGAVLSLFASIAAVDKAGAVSLMEGDRFKAAWAPLSLLTTHLFGRGPALGMVSFGGVLKRPDGSEYLYVGSQGIPDSYSTSASPISIPGIVDRLSVNYRAKGLLGPKHFFANAASKAFLVDLYGVRTYDDQSYVGTNKQFGDVLPNASATRWRFDKSKSNGEIADVRGVGDLLIIALESSGSAGGGVVVYNAKTDDEVNMHKDWSGINVIGLAIDAKNQAWAVTQKSLWLINSDGSKGPNFLDMIKEKTFSFPTTITSAQFVGDNLVLGTSDDGITVGTSSHGDS
jgi:hypothetical protein